MKTKETKIARVKDEPRREEFIGEGLAARPHDNAVFVSGIIIAGGKGNLRHYPKGHEPDFGLFLTISEARSLATDLLLASEHAEGLHKGHEGDDEDEEEDEGPSHGAPAASSDVFVHEPHQPEESFTPEPPPSPFIAHSRGIA